ncbi:hypothetical protein SAMN05444359_11816 [Neolewinella agarilytica]|uniref:Uncharacterized protein n=1 Tax=Neolewinella agarilytica TaxID=478744 RepID=A0A1H9JPV1_9BACT|nr:hypothetical protein SAMN05444359_11816 [Neolewinella agarilytica]
MGPASKSSADSSSPPEKFSPPTPPLLRLLWKIHPIDPAHSAARQLFFPEEREEKRRRRRNLQIFGNLTSLTMAPASKSSADLLLNPAKFSPPTPPLLRLLWKIYPIDPAHSAAKQLFFPEEREEKRRRRRGLQIFGNLTSLTLGPASKSSADSSSPPEKFSPPTPPLLRLLWKIHPIVSCALSR